MNHGLFSNDNVIDTDSASGISKIGLSAWSAEGPTLARCWSSANPSERSNPRSLALAFSNAAAQAAWGRDPPEAIDRGDPDRTCTCLCSPIVGPKLVAKRSSKYVV